MSKLSRLGKLLLPEVFCVKKYEISKKNLDITNIKTAKEIMCTKNFLGPEEVFEIFGVKLASSEIPPVPFSRKELEAATILNQKLILRINTAADGSPLTMKKMNEELEEKFKTAGKGKILYYIDLYEDEKIFTTDTPTTLKAEWALVSTGIIPNSTSKNYLEQTELLVDYLQKEIMPTLSKDKKAQYEEVITEFEAEKETIQKLMDKGNWLEANEQLAELQINQMIRQSPSQVLYDHLVTSDNKGERLLEAMYTWTTALGSSGELVYVGYFGVHGADVYGYNADDCDDELGVVFSRTS